MEPKLNEFPELPISEAELRASESTEEKRARLIREGTPVTYVVCPLCGMNRVLDKHAKGRAKWDKVDPEKALILQVRYGGGWGSGFYLDEDRSLTLEKMCRKREYRGITIAIRDQARKVLTHIESIFQRN